MLCFSLWILKRRFMPNFEPHAPFQFVDMESAYLCGYLKIKGLTEEFPTLTTFFDGEIISKAHPFLTRKWDADEDVDRKHWVLISLLSILELIRDAVNRHSMALVFAFECGLCIIQAVFFFFSGEVFVILSIC